ncbi:tetratricopeptide repeat protein [Streptomyces chartreusis]|uniref:tetratricopeptide repeat protein n=1 Tax=Streptomyces chartreusis TaxID=1969 RepID=UPI0033AE2B92
MGRQARYSEFGAAVRQLISDSGLTLDRIAEASRRPRRTRLTRTTLSSWQTGRNRPHSWAALETLLSIVGELSGLPPVRLGRQRWRALYTKAAGPPTPAPPPVAAQLSGGSLARDADPVLLGVRQARRSAEHGPLPPYVERDADREIDSALVAAAVSGGLVLIRGDSTAGKTRTAFEAMLRVLPDARLLCPARGDSSHAHVERARHLAGRGHRCVVWLDDLEHYLGPSLLDEAVLRQLVGLGAVLLATMRLSEYHQRAPRQTGTAGGDDSYARIDLSDPVLKAARVVDLPRRWSDGERARTETRTDPRLREALRYHNRYGVAEYVSAGPQLWDRWRNARYLGGSPRGQALVAAAVDLARAGLGPVSTELITSLHTAYLADEESAMLSPESPDEALAWACQDPLGVSRLLMPAGQGLWRPFEYLVDMLTQLADAPPVPEAVREAAVEHARTVNERFSVGVSCFRADRHDLALRALVPPAEGGHIDSMRYVASILLDMKKEARAATWWHRLAKAGDTHGMVNLGVRHARKGREKKAEKWWRRAFDAGQAEAAAKLAHLHEERGDSEEAERLWNIALDAEVPDAYLRFGLMAYEREEHEEAERFYREGARRGHHASLTNLAQVYLTRGRYDEAEELYRTAAEAGDCVAMRTLGTLSAWQGQIRPSDESREERMRRLSEAAASVRPPAWDTAAANAEEWYQRAFEQGDVLSLRLLGNLYHRHHKYGKADKCYRRAARLGDPASAAYFNEPGPALDEQPDTPRPGDERDDHDEDHGPWAPTPRTLRVLEAALDIEADMAAEGLEDLQDRPVTADSCTAGCFDTLPAQTWNQDRAWRRQLIRAFDDLCDDIRKGRLPHPRSTGEEMALHVALEQASCLTADDPQLVGEFTEGLPEHPEDYDWSACKDLLFKDHDVLWLYWPWMEGIENPDSDAHQVMRAVNLHPDDWFRPFRDDRRRDPDRGFRH